MKITMEHGSGGKSSAELMKMIFAKHFHNDVLDKMEDAAVIKSSGKIAFTTDSFVVTPLTFKGGDIGKLSVCGTVNDLLMMGATPKYITTAFILEEGLDTEILEQVVHSVKIASDEAGVKIVAGDTKVVEGRGGLYINTSGIGEIPEDVEISVGNCRAGDMIILSGTLGDHHSCILSERMNIKNNIASDCAPLNTIVLPLLSAGIEVRAMRDVTRGGLGTILNEICSASECGARLWQERLPVSPEVAGLCEILGLDPVHMGNEGKMILIVPEKQCEDALKIIKKSRYGKNASIIGKIKNDDKNVDMITSVGGIRKIDSLYGEGLPRIC